MFNGFRQVSDPMIRKLIDNGWMVSEHEVK